MTNSRSQPNIATCEQQLIHLVHFFDFVQDINVVIGRYLDAMASMTSRFEPGLCFVPPCNVCFSEGTPA